DAERAAGAAEIFDEHRTEQWLHPFGPLPADNVVDAAGRERHHELDRPVRKPGLGQRQRRAEHIRRCGKAESKAVSEDVAAIHREFFRHSTLNPSLLMIGVQRAYSVSTSFCPASGPESSTGSKPDL